MFDRARFDQICFDGAAAIFGAASLSGAGTVAAAARRTRTAAASPSGQGTLAATAQLAVVTAEASLAGVATLATAGKRTRTTALALAVAGTIASAAVAFVLSTALLAAQQKRRRLPYVEVRLRDLEQGVKRLFWTRLYDGSTPWRTPTGHNGP